MIYSTMRHAIMCVILAGVCAWPYQARAEGRVVLPTSPDLSGGLPVGWEPLIFRNIKRRTVYEWDSAERAIHAVSSASASGLLLRFDQETAAAPILRWRWRISKVIAGGDEKSKKGDDYAARIYVTFKYAPSRVGVGSKLKYGLIKKLYGEYPPHAGISYIWANKLPKGSSIANAYTDRVRMLAVRSGDSEANRWIEEERDILKDYRELFGEEAPPISGVAIMTDTDNTSSVAEAWFSDIKLISVQ